MTAATRLIKLLERMSPAATAAVLAHLLKSIPLPPPRAEREQPIDNGEAFEVASRRFRIRGELWGAGRHIHLVHGWRGWRQQLAALVGPLTETGHQVLAHDALGHGDSDPGPMGRRSGTVVDLATSLQAVAAAHGPVAGVVAHSAGATATLLAMLAGLRVERLVLIAPSFSLESMVRGLGVGEPTVRLLVDRLASELALDPAAFELLDIASRLPELPPLLVIHDTADREMPIEDSRQVVADWPGAELVETTGRGHRRVLWAPETVHAVAEFFADTTARPALTSGPAGRRSAELATEPR